MSLIVTAEVHDPMDVEISVTVRMSVRGWREVIKGLPDTYVNYWHAARLRNDLEAAIRDVEHKALRISAEEKA